MLQANQTLQTNDISFIITLCSKSKDNFIQQMKKRYLYDV